MSEVKRASDMTNEELQQVINRYNLEKNYNKILQEQNPKKQKFSDKATGYVGNKLLKASDQAVDAVLREVFVSAAVGQVKKKKV